MFHSIEKHVSAAFRAHIQARYGVDLPVVVEQPKQSDLGEMAVPAAFQLAKQLRQAPKKIAADFVKADLDVALTFAQIARQTDQQEKATRNRQNARKAYDVVLRYLGTANLNRSDQYNISRKLALLKSALFMLGESF